MMILETERLILRRLSPEDAPFILELVNDSDFLRYIGDKGVRNLDDARDYILKGPGASYKRFGFGMYLTQLREDATPIGMCGLLKRDTLDYPDVGFAFLPAFRRHGYALEAASATMAHGRRDFGMERVLAVVSSDNASSIRLLERLGLKFEGMIRMSEDEEEIRLFGTPVSP